MKQQIKVKAKKFHNFIINMSKAKKIKKMKRKRRIQKLMRNIADSTNSMPYHPIYPSALSNSGLSQSHQIITGMNEINQRLNNLNKGQVSSEIMRETTPIIRRVKEDTLQTPIKNVSDTNIPSSSIPLRHFENIDSPIHIKTSHSDDEIYKARSPEEARENIRSVYLFFNPSDKDYQHFSNKTALGKTAILKSLVEDYVRNNQLDTDDIDRANDWNSVYNVARMITRK